MLIPFGDVVFKNFCNFKVFSVKKKKSKKDGWEGKGEKKDYVYSINNIVCRVWVWDLGS
jgi:hypothetical protein